MHPRRAVGALQELVRLVVARRGSTKSFKPLPPFPAIRRDVAMLVPECALNLQAGLRPLIITLGEGVSGAAFLLKNSPLVDRVDILEVSQFLTANVYERSFFKAAACKVTLSKLLERYNEIVASCETDPSLRIKLGFTTDDGN